MSALLRTSLDGNLIQPGPLELAERLIRMFSFADDTVLDPFTSLP